MNRRTVIASVGALMGTSIATAAYSSATIERNANINVVTDDAGLIALADDGSSSFITKNSSGALTIDLTDASDNGGVNAESTYTFGNTGDAANDYAFTITNNDQSSRSISLGYVLDGSDPDTNTDSLQFKIYDSSGAAVETDTNGNITSTVVEGGSYSLSAAAGTTYYVVLQVDTTGLTSSADLSGTLSVTV